jgi:hypothetical protein
MRRNYGEEFSCNAQRFVRIRSSFSGTVSSGTTYYDQCNFPVPMETIPICIRAVSVSATSGVFSAAARADVANIDNYGFTVARTASANSNSASWQSIYSFGSFPWEFSDPVANYN